jgi:hypothetical protein
MASRSSKARSKPTAKPTRALSEPAARVPDDGVAAADPPRRIRVIPYVPPTPQTTMGRAIRPFARPAQSGTFAPFALQQARRGR